MYAFGFNMVNIPQAYLSLADTLGQDVNVGMCNHQHMSHQEHYYPLKFWVWRELFVVRGVELSCGHGMVLANVRFDGLILCFSAALHTAGQGTPTLVSAVKGKVIKQIAMGKCHIAVLTGNLITSALRLDY